MALVNLSGNPAYFSTSGTALTGVYSTVATRGVFMGGNTNDLMRGVEHGGSVVLGEEPVSPIAFKGGNIAISNDGMTGINYYSADYSDGVQEAIRSGYWNPVDGSWSTNPVGILTEYQDDVIDAMHYYIGGNFSDTTKL